MEQPPIKTLLSLINFNEEILIINIIGVQQFSLLDFCLLEVNPLSS